MADILSFSGKHCSLNDVFLRRAIGANDDSDKYKWPISNHDMKADDEFSKDISDEDSGLGFERFEIPQDQSAGDGVSCVVARILSPTDILVKVVDPDGGIQYAHRRWGYSKESGSLDLIEWQILEVPFSFDEAALFLQEYQFKSPNDAVSFYQIVGVPFKHRKL